MTGRIEQQFFVSSQKKVIAPKQIDRSNTFPPTLFFCLCRDAPDYIHTRKVDDILGVSLLTNQLSSLSSLF